MTLSKERLAEITSGDSSQLITVSEALAMARELLALRERAEPGNYRVVHLDALGAACGALQRYAPASETLALLRRYTFGDLSAITLAPPAPVVPDGLRMALSNAGIAAPESDEALWASQQDYIQMLVTWVKDRKPFKPAPVVPEAIENAIEYIKSIAFHIDENDYHGQHIAHFMQQAIMWLEGDACRAAMLQGAGPVSQPYKLPDGWVAVPVEPTKEMIEATFAGQAEIQSVTLQIKARKIRSDFYRAMLAAAPAPGKEG